jgi:hypothetical protein
MSTESSEEMTETIVLENMTDAQELAVRVVMNTGAYEDRKRVAEFVDHYSKNGKIKLTVKDFLGLLYSGKSRLEELPNGKEK